MSFSNPSNKELKIVNAVAKMKDSNYFSSYSVCSETVIEVPFLESTAVLHKKLDLLLKRYSKEEVDYSQIEETEKEIQKERKIWFNELTEYQKLLVKARCFDILHGEMKNCDTVETGHLFRTLGDFAPVDK